MYKKLLLLVFVMFCAVSEAKTFTPEQPTISVNELKPDMNGYILTVLKGFDPVKIPVKIISIIPQKPGTYVSEQILIKFMGNNKLSQGMSGSPVYVDGKIAGAVRSGWEQSDHTLALVTPIDAMCRIFADDMTAQNNSFPLVNASVSGVHHDSSQMLRLGRVLGLTFTQGVSVNSRGLDVKTVKLSPGDSVSVMLAWGDVEISASGTVTATSRDGRFLAFGHEFMKRGGTAYPSARSFVHDTVNSSAFPFKLTSPETINGIITRDTEAGIGGKFGVYPSSISAELVFVNLDAHTQRRYKFRVAADEFASPALLSEIFAALCEESWGRKGQGTMSVNLRIDGRNLPNGWARRDIFYSDNDIISESFEQAKNIIGAFLTQPFTDTMPAGFTLTVEATQKPRVLMIENVKAPDSAKPGENVNISVKLRGWRTAPIEREFTLKIPDDASEGVCEVVVRGGGSEAMGQTAVEEGYKSIDSLERMLTEFRAADANNELILEINTDRLTDILEQALKGKNAQKHEDLLPEETEYLSETKQRRIKEGTLKIYSSDYFIAGMMKGLIHVHND